MRPRKVFITHAHEDATMAVNLKRVVEGAFLGLVQCFVTSDPESLTPGEEWFSRLVDELKAADLLIVLVTGKSVRRPWTYFEAGHVYGRGRHVMPICAGIEKDEVGLPLSYMQMASAQDEREMRAVAGRLANLLGADTPKELPRLLQEVLHTEPVNWEQPQSNVADEPDAETHQERVTRRVAYLVHTAELFDHRVGEAFPGLRGIKEVDAVGAVEALGVLLRELSPADLQRYSLTSKDGDVIWWVRGPENMYIRAYRVLDGRQFKVLIDDQEVILSKVVVLRHHDCLRTCVYLESAADKPTGVSGKDVERGAYEEVGIWKGHYVTRQEFDDGFAIIDGRRTELAGADVRFRYLEPRNLLLCAKGAVYNRHWNDRAVEAVMDGLLAGKPLSTLEHLANTLDDYLED